MMFTQAKLVLFSIHQNVIVVKLLLIDLLFTLLLSIQRLSLKRSKNEETLNYLYNFDNIDFVLFQLSTGRVQIFWFL